MQVGIGFCEVNTLMIYSYDLRLKSLPIDGGHVLIVERVERREYLRQRYFQSQGQFPDGPQGRAFLSTLNGPHVGAIQAGPEGKILLVPAPSFSKLSDA